MELDEMEEIMRQLESVQDSVADWGTDELLENLEATIETMEELIADQRSRMELEEDD